MDVEKYGRKIEQYRQEELQFRKDLHSLFSGDKKLASKPLVIGKTGNALSVCGADAGLPLTITKKVIEKCIRPEIRDENGKLVGKTGHGLTIDNVIASIDSLKIPIFIFKGTHENSLLVVTDVKEKRSRNIVVAISLNEKEGFEKVNRIRSAYGRDNIENYIEKNMRNGNLIAINIKKANDMFHSIEKWYLKENPHISFDNTIAYTTENVKYPEKIKENGDLR